ncbi:unnamed protein product [Boreogadus saida]
MRASKRLATNQTPRPGPSDPQVLRHKTLTGPPDPDPSDPNPPGPWLVQGVWDPFRVLGPSLHSLVQLGARFPKTFLKPSLRPDSTGHVTAALRLRHVLAAVTAADRFRSNQ